MAPAWLHGARVSWDFAKFYKKAVLQEQLGFSGSCLLCCQEASAQGILQHHLPAGGLSAAGTDLALPGGLLGPPRALLRATFWFLLHLLIFLVCKSP